MIKALEQKISMIDAYIANLDSAITAKDNTKASDLIDEVIGVYSNEIQNITHQLDHYRWGSGNCTDDAKKLKAKLENYKYNLSSGLFKTLQGADGGINVTQQVNQDVNTNITVTLDQVINTINAMKSSELTDEEKEILSGKLASISAEKDKQKKWEKVGNALKWIAEKGIEVGKAALPYIVQSLGAGS